MADETTSTPPPAAQSAFAKAQATAGAVTALGAMWMDLVLHLHRRGHVDLAELTQAMEQTAKDPSLRLGDGQEVFQSLIQRTAGILRDLTRDGQQP
jgi:hypothetical protein